MPLHLLSTDDFRAAARDGLRPDGPVFRFSTSEPQTVGADAARTMRFVFSDATVDHSDDSIDPKGWDTSIFKRNPVALFSHMSWEPPIGRSPYVAVHGDKLVGDIEFASAEVYPFADTIYRLLKGGFMNAVSVGFLPKEWAFSSDKKRPTGIDFKKQILLEISVCPVPCNPNALGQARSLGIDTRPLADWAERALDHGDTIALPRTGLEALRSQARDSGRRRLTRGATPAAHPLQATIDDVGASIGATRRAIRDVQDALTSPADPALDEAQLRQAIGHFTGAITSKNMALACIRAAMPPPPGDAEPDPPGDVIGQNPPSDLAERVREAERIQRAIAAPAPARTPAERRVEAADIVRRAKAEGLL